MERDVRWVQIGDTGRFQRQEFVNGVWRDVDEPGEVKLFHYDFATNGIA